MDDEEEYIPTSRDKAIYYYLEHERTFLEIFAGIAVVFGIAIIGFLYTLFMGILTLSLGMLINKIYRRVIATKATNTLSQITGNQLEPPANIRQMYELLDYFEYVRDTNGELDEGNPLVKKKLNGEDVAYQ